MNISQMHKQPGQLDITKNTRHTETMALSVGWTYRYSVLGLRCVWKSVVSHGRGQ